MCEKNENQEQGKVKKAIIAFFKNGVVRLVGTILLSIGSLALGILVGKTYFGKDEDECTAVIGDDSDESAEEYPAE
jgi:hypothetical protein